MANYFVLFLEHPFLLTMNRSSSIPSGFGKKQPAVMPGIIAPEKGVNLNQRRPTVRRLTVRQMLAKYTGVPAQTAMLGVCDDGLPVLLDLTDDHPGPILVTADDACGKTELMQTILNTAITSNSPYEVKYSVIASNPDEWSIYNNPSNSSHCMSFQGYFESGAGETIMRLAEIAEQRRVGKEEGAAILLMIDDLRFMPKADFDVRINFEWLLKNGPSQQIWPVVSLPTQSAMEMSRMVTYFRTRLIGHMPASTNTRLSLYSGLDTECLEPGKQFAVRVQDQWLNFWAPAVD
jgi:hypothetical protein